jgi:hypothetical protein
VQQGPPAIVKEFDAILEGLAYRVSSHQRTRATIDAGKDESIRVAQLWDHVLAEDLVGQVVVQGTSRCDTGVSARHGFVVKNLGVGG